MKKTVSILLCILLLSGCSGEVKQLPSENGDLPAVNQGTVADAETETNIPEASFENSDDDMFTKRDKNSDYSEADSVKISLLGNSAEASSNSVVISGNTITLTENKTHIISGSFNGTLIVDAPEDAKLQLVFNGVSIKSESSAALYIKEADKVVITLVGENTLESGESFVAIDDSNIDSALFSKQDLTFNGQGSLTVTSPVGHGIVGKDDLVFVGGSYLITAASHGIEANDSVRIKDADIAIDSGKDGIQCENSDDTEKGFVYISSGKLNIECEGDGISAGAYLQILNGEFEILAGGGYENGTKEASQGWGNFGGGFGGGFSGGRPQGTPPQGGKERTGESQDNGDFGTISTETDSSSSMKGLKAVSGILISGGSFKIDSADDSIHCDTSITITDGEFEIASGDDALHAEESLQVSGGKFDISTCYEGLEALHVAVSGGDIKLKATDDGINAAGGTDQSGTGGRDEMFGGRPGGMGGGFGGSSNGSIVISGGNLYINSSGDGIDANGTLEISGGHTVIVGPTQGDTTTLDYDKTGVITGGTFIGTGSSMMAQSFSDSEQGVIAVSVGTQQAETEITLTDKDGNVVITHSPELSFQIVILSSPDIIKGESYTITVGTQTGTFEAE